MTTSQDYRSIILSASDEVPMNYCDRCSYTGKQSEAEGQCEDCTEYLCGLCYKEHLQYKCKSHTLKEKNDMPLDGVRTVEDSCVTKCKHHRDKIVEYFCVSCDNLCCSVCVRVNHRRCENVEHIPHIADKQEIEYDLYNFSDKLKNISTRLDERHRMILCNSQINQDMLQLAKKELKRQRDHINRYFDEMEREMDKKVGQIHKQNKNNLKAASNLCGSMKTALHSIESDIHTKQNNGQKCELFIAMKNAKSKLAKVSSDLETLKTESRLQKFKLVPSSQTDDMKKVITKICEIKTAKLESEINVNTSSDSTMSSIWGLTKVHGHYCVAADGDNQTVKVIDTTRNCVTSEMNIGGEARAVTTVNDDLVAVPVSQDDARGKIQILSVSQSGSLRKHSQIDTKGICNGIAYSRGNLFVAQYSQVKILNMQGKVMKTISSDSKGKDLFSYAIGLVVSPDNETIYVLDSSKNSVISMTMEGEMRALYKDPGLANPQGITVDNDGYVYVCSPSTRTIHQLSSDFTKLQILLDEVYGRDILTIN